MILGYKVRACGHKVKYYFGIHQYFWNKTAQHKT